MDAGDLLSRIEDLQQKIKSESQQLEGKANYALACLESLYIATDKNDLIFGIEPWHPMAGHGSVLSPCEYLLRLNDENGEALPPYPAIMYFYDHGLTAELDTVLFLCGLRQFERDDEKQVSINISAKSLQSSDFIKTVLAALEAMGLAPNKPEKIIIEIHESTSEVMSRHVLELFQKFGASFAIDDVGLTIKDVFRISEFEGIADYIKIDRHSVCAHPEDPQSLAQVMSLVRSLLPGAVVIAEGVKTTQHAMQIHSDYPDIQYVQGLYLPTREVFAQEWEELAKKQSPKEEATG